MKLRYVSYDGVEDNRGKKIIEDCIKGRIVEIDETELDPDIFCVSGNVVQEKVKKFTSHDDAGLITYEIV